jgi:hypothetical protein
MELAVRIGQSTHEVAPRALWNLPAGHETQTVRPVSLWCVPASHFRHLAWPSRA